MTENAYELKASYTIDEVSKIITLGRTKIYENINAGTLKARKLGRKTIILKEDLEQFLTNLEPYKTSNSDQ